MSKWPKDKHVVVDDRKYNTHMRVAHLVEEVFAMDSVAALAQCQRTYHSYQDKAD